LGGHNGIFTAVFDERIKVVVSSCGFDSFRDYKNGDIRGWTSVRYMPRLLQYPLTDLPFDFHELIASLAPRFCFVSAPLGDSNFKWQSVDAVTGAARKVFELYGFAPGLEFPLPTGEGKGEGKGTLRKPMRLRTGPRQSYEAGDRLQVEHPDCLHLFPPEMQEKAFELMERVLK
jgi:hypothetical protein